jgi:hypothetical protein
MSESMYMGPLDTVREAVADAEILDLLTVEASKDSEDFDYIEDVVGELDSKSALLGHRVVAKGMVLTMSMDEESRARAFTMPPDGEVSEVKGIYHGFTVRSVSELEGDGNTFRVTHAIQTGTEKYNDDLCHVHTVEEITFVCAYGSELTPQLPYKAHSIQDLEFDPLTMSMEEIAIDGSLYEYQRLKYLAAKVNQFLFDRYETDLEDGLDLQRVSYLNELGLFQNIIVRTYDFAVADNRDSYSSFDNVRYSSTDEPVQISIAPEIIDILPGYNRMPDGTVIEGGPPELFAAATNYDGTSLLLPLRYADDFVFVDERALAA